MATSLNTDEPRYQYHWSWRFQAPPEKVWPLVSDTQRFNEATGLPPTRVVETPDPEGGASRSVSFRRLGIPVTWHEQPFDWIRPHNFGVLRVYGSGPVAWMRIMVRLKKTEDGGTELTYKIDIEPANILGHIAIPLQVGWLSRRAFDRVFRAIDSSLRSDFPQVPAYALPVSPLTPNAGGRLAAMCSRLAANRERPEIVDLLSTFISTAQDADLVCMRPFALADQWRSDRIETLELFLEATKIGLLDMSWDLMCPECRGAKSTATTLANIDRHAHCLSCNIDYEVTFDENVEVTFHPNPGIKQVFRMIFCAGGPQNTPHIVAQIVVEPDSERTCTIPLDPGNYRLRGPRLSGPNREKVVGSSGPTGQVSLKAGPEGPNSVDVSIEGHTLSASTKNLMAGSVTFDIKNPTETEQVIMVERADWVDHAATAAQVTNLQPFRDLFSSDALRPREQIAVNHLTVLFTDLKGSTAMYRDIGDATAFGQVMDHFVILKDHISRNRGCVVKTIGDAVMATFSDPENAVAAALDVFEAIRNHSFNEKLPPLSLKMGIHSGPCIAVTQNDRLDYFGSAVNIAARVEAQSNGDELVVSEEVIADPGVASLLKRHNIRPKPFQAELKGFTAPFTLHRISG